MKLYQILSHDLARFFRTKAATPLGRITRREVPGSVASVYIALATRAVKERASADPDQADGGGT